MKGRLLGFDYGRKRIGVATGNLQTATSEALKTLPAANGGPDWPSIVALAREWRPDLLIVGLPLRMDGSDGDLCDEVRHFAAELSNLTTLPVRLVDERLSSSEADHLISAAAVAGKSRQKQRQAMRDSLAAELIIQTYLNDNR